MITCAASSAGQENNISKFLLCFVSLLISSQALTLEIETPAILLTTVPDEIRVSGALPGEQVRLSIAGASRVASADADGIAAFPEIVAE